LAIRGGLQKARVPKDNVAPLAIFSNGDIGNYVRYRIISSDRIRSSHWSPIYEVPVEPFTILGNVSITSTPTTVTAIWDDAAERPQYDVFTRFGNLADKVSIAADSGSSPATSTVHVKMHTITGFQIGDPIFVNLADQQSLVNGNFTISNIITSGGKHEIFYKIPGSYNTGNEISTSGFISQQPFYHGTSPIHTYSFLRLPLFTIVLVDIQAEGINKVYYNSLLIYNTTSPHTLT
jgi:hypothetical protein